VGRGLEGYLSIAYLDTHIAGWLYSGEEQRLTDEAKRQIERNDLLISPMILLEFQLLLERKRFSKEPLIIYSYLQGRFGVNLCSFPFSAIITEALSCTWTRDPFDRIIVSHAKANGHAVLITADRRIRQHYPSAKW
jgi:PIN domain nuclease of toxin-antitoxin system